jgi:alkyl hydroperoxide reductase subunit AhpF
MESQEGRIELPPGTTWRDAGLFRLDKYYAVPITYCPFCGKRLENEDATEKQA